jgi:hypothetical protein
MAPHGLRAPPGGRVGLGPQKLILDDATLPSAGDLASQIADAHRQGTAIAVHCVTAQQLVVCAAAFEQAGALEPADQVPAFPDRVEHASVVPPGYAGELARLKIAVVTQPGFIAQRGDAYLAQVPAPEQDWLYPCASLLQAGVAVAASTDAPFGPPDPWECMATATAVFATFTTPTFGPAQLEYVIKPVPRSACRGPVPGLAGHFATKSRRYSTTLLVRRISVPRGRSAGA